MDKSWMNLDDRTLPEYENGVKQFLDFAYSTVGPSKKIRCPCRKCNNVYYFHRDDVEADLFQYGIKKDYDPWDLHGEEYDDSSEDEFMEEDNDQEFSERNTNDSQGNHNDINDMQEMIEDYYAAASTNSWSGTDFVSTEDVVPKWESDKFMRLLLNADQELYPGCKRFSKLSFVVTMMHLKILNRWSKKSFSMLLEELKEALPDGEKLPCSYYEAKKIIRNLGLDYQKIHACVNDCILYRKQYEKEEKCPHCSAPRYKNDHDSGIATGKKQKKIPQKVLRYFPLKPRLQRLLISQETAKDMRWHVEKRKDDGVLRHPADAQEWKEFDQNHKSFAKDSRNVRLGLATNGFNPFSNMSTPYSIWPVILLPYNLPPWKCLKTPFFILSMLIPGPSSPCNNIDVYLEPLIEEQKDLWDHGIETYDSFSGTRFNLRAALLWTINDFPAYGIASGWCTKGYLACPVCNKDTSSFWLKNGKKVRYMDHRRFLPPDHRWRDLKSAFNGKKELKHKPVPLSGDDIIEQLKQVDPVTFGKTQPKRKKSDKELNWRKHSIFFRLPYWRTLKLRHCLDVMHIKKNVCDNILGTLLDLEGKSKDNIKARFDLQALGIRPQLHPELIGNSYVVPPACFTLSTDEKRKLCAFLASVKYPDGYAASLLRRVNTTQSRVTGLKTHDCHVILQKLLPIAVRGLLNNDVCDAIHEVADFFTQLCSKTLNRGDLEYLEDKMAITLCKLERIFPPAFFDIMVHLPIHLAREAILGGPVQYRWMYPIERYVSNKAFPDVFQMMLDM